MASLSWSIADPLRKKTTSTAEVNFFGRTPAARDVYHEINLPKVPGADPYLEQSFAALNPAAKNITADTALFRSEVGRTQPVLGEYNQQEIDDITRYFTPGGYEQQLSDVRGRRAKAMAGLSDAILGDLRKILNLNARGGVGGTGLGSYLTSTAAAQAARTRADEAVDASTQERADLAALMGLRSGAAGKRQMLTDALLQRMLAPAAQEATLSGAWNQQLQQALNAALANLAQGWAQETSGTTASIL